MHNDPMGFVRDNKKSVEEAKDWSQTADTITITLMNGQVETWDNEKDEIRTGGVREIGIHALLELWGGKCEEHENAVGWRAQYPLSSIMSIITKYKDPEVEESDESVEDAEDA
jgi:hypothetical protein